MGSIGVTTRAISKYIRTRSQKSLPLLLPLSTSLALFTGFNSCVHHFKNFPSSIVPPLILFLLFLLLIFPIYPSPNLYQRVGFTHALNTHRPVLLLLPLFLSKKM